MSTPPPDRLNDIGVLTRREIEARILAPFIDALAQEFDRERVLAILRETIIQVARAQGRELAAGLAGDSLLHFARATENWRKGGALEMEVIEETDNCFAFNVQRCRYAEMYRALGVPELGAVLSCNRDAALIKGFNPNVELQRAQTIMAGAACCDFRYTRQLRNT